MDKERTVQEIPIEDIIPNRFQPRLTFNEDGLNELSESIKQHGIIQPLVVRRLGDKFEIIAGERRYKAATQAGLTKVPVIISDIDDNKSAEVALVENIQRRNLTAIEEAKSYKNLLDRGYLTQEQLALKMGVSQSAIANKLRLLNLAPEVQDALLNEKISERHARALLNLETNEEQNKWLKRIINERMTVRQLDIELKKNKEENGEEDTGIPLVDINPDIDSIINSAEDINVVRESHNIENLLMPSDLMLEQETQEKKNPEPEKQSQSESKIPNKFFNFLEDEEVNLETDDSSEPEQIFNSFVFTEPKIEPQVEEKKEEIKEEPIMEMNNVEILDELDSIEGNNSLNETNTIKELESSSVENNSVLETNSDIMNNSNEETNEPFKSIFFNDFNSLPSSQIDEEPSNNIITNTIEEIETKEEPLIDPMDSVIKLEPDYDEKQEELEGLDLPSAINTIRETIDRLNRKGFLIEMEEADLEDLYHITIKINKNE